VKTPGRESKPVLGGLFRQFSTTVIDQVVISGANFFIGFLLIRRTSDVDYGMFVLVQSAITLLTSAQMSWLSSPLAVVAPAKPPDVRRLMVGSLESSQRSFLRKITALAMLAPLVGYFAHYWNAVEALVVGLGAVACWTALQREYLRNVLLIYRRPHSMLNADLVFVGVLLAGAVVAAFGPGPAGVWAVCALIVAALAGEAAARRSLTADPGFEPARPESFGGKCDRSRFGRRWGP
jgi:O-antigen/teichoic acid export membrane protein